MNKKLKKSNVQDIFELSTIQKGMLYQYLRKKDENLYHAQLSLVMEGIVDPDTLRRAFKIVQSNNDILRVVFRWKKLNRPLQVVLKDCSFDFSYTDISDTGIDTAKITDLVKKHLDFLLIGKAENNN